MAGQASPLFWLGGIRLARGRSERRDPRRALGGFRRKVESTSLWRIERAFTLRSHGVLGRAQGAASGLPARRSITERCREFRENRSGDSLSDGGRTRK